MSDQLESHVEQTAAFARYLSWADLLNRLFEAEIASQPPAGDTVASRDHEWRWFGLMCYWYSSLHVVVEGWDQLGFSDPVIEKLLEHPKQFRKLLRQFRNAVFHYQSSLLDPRFVRLLGYGAAHVYWIRVLHDEFVRFFAEFLARQMVTDEQRVELREIIEAVIQWYPYPQAPQLESLERTLSHGRQLLSKYPDDRSQQREEAERSLELGEAALREARRNLAAFRARMLREAGVEEGDVD